jgi:hypothetical protein
MTKAQQTLERIDALVDGGMKKAEAFKQLADEYGQPIDSVRGAYYAAKRQTTGSGGPARSRSRKRETTTQDAIASAVATLQAAIDAIERELEVARERADEARAEYEAMRAASSGRVAEIRAKIAVLDPTTAEEATTPAPAASPQAKPAAGKAPTRKEAAGS